MRDGLLSRLRNEGAEASKELRLVGAVRCGGEECIDAGATGISSMIREAQDRFNKKITLYSGHVLVVLLEITPI